MIKKTIEQECVSWTVFCYEDDNNIMISGKRFEQ